MNNKRYSKEDVKEIIGAIKLITKESDSFAPILVESILDYLLQAILVHQLREGSKSVRDKLFSGYGPFSTFSAKLNILYCMGIIKRALFNDLNIIRKIRNLFAHKFKKLTFGDTEVKNLCNGFEIQEWIIKDLNSIAREIVKDFGPIESKGLDGRQTFNIVSSCVISSLAVIGAAIIENRKLDEATIKKEVLSLTRPFVRELLIDAKNSMAEKLRES